MSTANSLEHRLGYYQAEECLDYRCIAMHWLTAWCNGDLEYVDLCLSSSSRKLQMCKIIKWSSIGQVCVVCGKHAGQMLKAHTR